MEIVFKVFSDKIFQMVKVYTNGEMVVNFKVILLMVGDKVGDN